MRSKLEKIRSLYSRQGLLAATAHAAGSPARHLGRLGWDARSRWRDARKRLRAWWRGDNWVLGKYVELRGNRFVQDGLSFSLDNPRILTRLKSRFYRSDYEQDERRLLPAHLDPTLPTVEVGGCIGVVSCLTNRLLDDPTRHVVIEANPYLVPTLEANRDRNGCRFRVLNQALAYGLDRVEFSIHDLFVGGSVQRETGEKVPVPATTLERVLRDEGFDAINLIFDAEGAEVDLFEHESEVLRRHVARIIVELHGRIVGTDRIDRVIARLGELGFESAEPPGVDPTNSTMAFYNRALVVGGAPASAAAIAS